MSEMNENKLSVISKEEIEKASVSSLPTRPNAPPAMGGSGMSPRQLRERFDALATLAIEKINAVLASLNGETINGEDATPFAQYIQTTLGKEGGGNYTLAEVLSWLHDETFAGKIILVDGEDPYTLAEFYGEFGDKVRAIVDTIVKTHNANDQSHPAIRAKIAEITAKIDAFLDSNDVNLDQLSEIIEFIKNNKPVDPPLVCLYTIEPSRSIEEIISNDGNGTWFYRDAFSLNLFNRTPKTGERFFAYGRSLKDHIPFHITAEITEINEAGNAVFKTLEAVPGSMPVFDITSIDNIYVNADALPSNPTVGACYIAFYGGKPSLYSYVQYTSQGAVIHEGWQLRENLMEKHLYWVKTGAKAGFYKFDQTAVNYPSSAGLVAVSGGGGGSVIVEQEFKPESINAQSGKAVADAVAEANAYADEVAQSKADAALASATKQIGQAVSELPSKQEVTDEIAQKVSTAISNHNIDQEKTSHTDIRGTIAALQAAFEAFLDVDDKTLDQLSEIVAYIKSNKGLIDAITTSKVSVDDIINNLTTNESGKPLSAAQGVALKALIDALSDVKLDKSALTDAINQALALAKASGDFKGDPGLSPTINVSKANGVTTLTIFDAETTIQGGKKLATINDGTSVSVKSTTTSDEDGGTNIVTFSDGEKLYVKNGSKGSSVTHRWEGTRLVVTSASGTTSADLKGNSVADATIDENGNLKFGMTEGQVIVVGKVVGADGKTPYIQNGFWYIDGTQIGQATGANGTTPQKGVDYFTETDVEEIVVRCVDAIKEGGVVGVVDENKNILLSGNLEDGTYTLSYEREDGTVCGTTLVVTAPIAEPKNFFVIDGEGYILNGRCNSEGKDRQDTGAYIVTNYMDVQAGDIIRLSGGPLSQVSNACSGMKLTTGAIVGFTSDNTEFISNGTAVNGVTEFTINKADADAVRFCLSLVVANGNTSKPIDNAFVENQNIVINIQRDGVWLTK